MGRRVRSNSNTSAQVLQNNSRNAHLNQLRALTNQSPHPAVGGMSPNSRYNHNLKVLRRRDPSIVSIFDQFSHVCLYHHNGEKWEKKGYEGSMFLYERDAYPPYGFYILNRMGMDDYIQRMYPEDDMNILGDYLMYKCYPDYTGLRLGLHMDSHRGIDPDLKNDKHKGRSITVGLWMFATESREPMKDVMMRLHDYIRRDESYPDEFRYGPDRPPPPNPHLRITNDSPEQSGDVDKATTNGNSSSDSGLNGLLSGNSNGMTDIDKLFAKIAPPKSTSSTSRPTKVVPKTSVQSLFTTSLESSGSSHSPSPRSRASSSVSNRGLALLDSIFASATPKTTNLQPREAASRTTASIHIVSPKPTISTQPQVLNQNVISTLLGLTPSPGGSISPASTHRTGCRYEGDNESNSEGSGFSEDAQAFEKRLSGNGIPSFSFTSLAADFATGHPESSQVQGDVTPRPALKGIRTSTPPPTELTPSNRRKTQSQPQQKPRQHLQPSLAKRDGRPASTVAPARQPEGTSGRPLVPFEPNSELWPYPRAPLDDRSLDVDGDVVELDYSDTSALSDPHIFEGKLNGAGGAARKKKDKKKAKDKEQEQQEIERSWDDPVTGTSAIGPATTTTPQRTGICKGKGKQISDNSNSLLLNGTASDKNSSTSKVSLKAIPTKLDSYAAKESLLSTASLSLSHKHAVDSGKMDRNEFVREVLTLIHTDKSFVDSLWADYLARTAK